MQIYSYNNETKELIPETLREADYLDACTPSIPLNSVIANSKLPVLLENQTFIVTGKRNADGYFTVTGNVSTIDDFRGQKVYLKTTGEEIVYRELGAFPDTVTSIVPPPYSQWSESENKWVEKTNAEELRLKDRRKNAGSLNRNQILTQIELEHGENKEKLVEIAERELTGIHLIKVRNAIMEAQTFTLENDDIWQFFTDTLDIDQDRL
ncbi:hypothetical protein, partial [Snodgrassella sp. ESL0324]|uniref:hypothetical protein n=1 Tax=Snodgrassella sp. ESL0324 TaxID=2705033 RepID=UPI00351BE573|nr:hypothetical protein [Snodgrassella sp. ESL0324]